MSNFCLVCSQVWVLFALMGVGYAARRLKMIGEETVRGMVSILFFIVTPCITVDVFQRPFDPALFKALGIAMGIAFLSQGISALLAPIFIRERRPDTRAVLKEAVVFSNAGFMGIPLEQAILGDTGVFYGSAYIVMFHLFMWSWGIATMQRAEETDVRRNWLKMTVNPGTVGLALGLPLFFLSMKLPTVLATPIHLLAGLNTPLAMIVIGFYLVGINPMSVFRSPWACIAMALRLIVIPLAVSCALACFHPTLDRTMCLAVVIAAAAPVAAMVSMFAAKFHRDVTTSVALVSATTLLSALTMPAVIALAMSLF